MSPHDGQDLVELARACRVLARFGHADLNLGHLSFRDPQGRGFWMKRAGPGLDEVDPDDLLLISGEGRVREGNGILHVEWPIHAAVLHARPDVNAVGHTHAEATALLSAIDGATVRPLTHAGALFAGVARFDESSGLIASLELGERLAVALGAGVAVLMRNHGATFCGRTLGSAVVAGIQLERAARAELALAATGMPALVPDAEESAAKRTAIYTDAGIEGFYQWCVRRLSG